MVRHGENILDDPRKKEKMKEEMDEWTKEIIDYIHHTLNHYPHPEDLEWSTEQIQTLLSDIKELQGHADKLGEIINGQNKKRLELEEKLSNLNNAILNAQEVLKQLLQWRIQKKNIVHGFPY